MISSVNNNYKFIKMKNIFEYIPEWIWTALGGIIGLGLFALVMMLGDYLNSIQ